MQRRERCRDPGDELKGVAVMEEGQIHHLSGANDTQSLDFEGWWWGGGESAEEHMFKGAEGFPPCCREKHIEVS